MHQGKYREAVMPEVWKSPALLFPVPFWDDAFEHKPFLTWSILHIFLWNTVAFAILSSAGEGNGEWIQENFKGFLYRLFIKGRLFLREDILFR